MPIPQNWVIYFLVFPNRTPQKNELLAAALVPSGTLSRSLSNGILSVLVLLAGKMPALQEIYGILSVLVLLAGKMPTLQEILGYFLNWKSLINWKH
jgi:hypothetical protein